MEQNGVEGKAVQIIWLDPASYPQLTIKVGAVYGVICWKTTLFQ